MRASGVLLICVSLLIGSAWPLVARGDSEGDALLLARICVSEAGWTCWDTNDGVAIHEVLLRGARRNGLSWRSFARSYASRATGAEPTTHPRLSWIAELDASGRAPASWPTMSSTVRRDGTVAVRPHPPWSRYREQWLAILSRAREVIRLTLETSAEWSVCDTGPEHWGGVVDRERARRLRLVPVSCGETVNDFYVRPASGG